PASKPTPACTTQCPPPPSIWPMVSGKKSVMTKATKMRIASVARTKAISESRLRRCAGRRTLSEPEELLDGVDRCLATNGGDGIGERDLLRADAHAVLRVAAIDHTTRSRHLLQALVLQVLARGIQVEQVGLPDGAGADE